MTTYFPIPGEGAWVLLREFCQTKERKNIMYADRKQVTHSQKNSDIHGIYIAFLWF